VLRTGQIQGEGFIVSGVQNGLKMRKLQSLKIKGVKNSKKANHQTLQRPVPKHSKKYLFMLKTQKNKPPNMTKTNSQTSKKIFLCCYVVIRVQKRFVKL
jgi:hypothetical protein